MSQGHIISYTRKKGKSSRHSRGDAATGTQSCAHAHNFKKTHCNGARKVSLSGFVSPWFRTGRRHKSIPLTRIQNDRKAPLVTSKPSFKTHCLEYSPLAKSWSCIKHGKAEVLALHPPTTCAAPL